MCLEDCGGVDRRTFVASALAFPLAGCVSAGATAEGFTRRTIEFQRDGAPIDGYVAYPTDARDVRLVTVMHGNAGLPADVRDTVDWLATLGFAAIAVNPTAREPDSGTIPRELLRGRAFGDRYIEDTRAGISTLRRSGVGRPNDRIAIVGYCGGGYCGLLWNDTPHRSEVGPLVGIHVALRNRNRDGSVSNERPQGLDLYRLAEFPTQFHYGTADALTPNAILRNSKLSLPG